MQCLSGEVALGSVTWWLLSSRVLTRGAVFNFTRELRHPELYVKFPEVQLSNEI